MNNNLNLSTEKNHLQCFAIGMIMNGNVAKNGKEWTVTWHAYSQYITDEATLDNSDGSGPTSTVVFKKTAKVK